jgi:hypothetical protein
MPLLGYFERKKQEKEIERDLQARQGKLRIKKHISKQHDMTKRLWELGKKALQLGEKKQFRQIILQYMWTLEDIKRWERSLLTFEAIEARRDQARSTADFLKSVQAMSKSILASASPKAMVETQRDLELGIARAQDMEERLSMILDMTDETVFAPEEMAEGDVEAKLQDVEHAMSSDAEHEEGAAFDERIEKGLKQVEEEMRKEPK